MAAMPSTSTDPEAYNAYIESMRTREYPMLKDDLYLDHAGTTLPSRRLLDRFHSDLLSNLYGNPHSASPSSQLSTRQIDDVRLQLLAFFKADPEEFDLVFTANATAGIKLVAEALREQDGGFWFGYHVESHTSVVGLRTVAREGQCFDGDEAVERWLNRPGGQDEAGPALFAYPAQSNMNGRRLPLRWCQKMGQRGVYTLLDAAAYASTSPLDLSDPASAPAFTVLSLYKIFGFPDLGALIVRKDAAPLFERRKYFGGGTVDMVVCLKEQWHARKSGALHEQLEDGTLPIHNIVALRSALQTHRDLFGTLERVSCHTATLAKRLYDGLKALKHANGRAACTIYKDPSSVFADTTPQGPIVAFNLRNSSDGWVSTTEVEKLASVEKIHLRTGGVCNPGGVASSLGLAPWEMRDNFSAGHRCGSDDDILNGKPTGVIRVSLGAMSTTGDVDRFIDFVQEYFVDAMLPSPGALTPAPARSSRPRRLHLESLTVYPIKSCAGWSVPFGTPWDVRREGLAWDREWCIVHRGTGAALSQKQHPRMALIRPSLDFSTGHLRIRFVGRADSLAVPLSLNPAGLECLNPSNCPASASVCGDSIAARLYTSPAVAEALSAFLGVACTLARFPAAGPAQSSTRHSKAHLVQPSALRGRQCHQSGNPGRLPPPLLLSNESPVLVVSRSSLNALNEALKARGARAAHPSVFRANMVLSEASSTPPGEEKPWVEDGWEGLRIGAAVGGEGDGGKETTDAMNGDGGRQRDGLGGTDAVELDVLGGCRRCQMVCVDQETGGRESDVFLTLAKMRRIGGRVLFGVHCSLGEGKGRVVSVGDMVEAM